MKLSELLFEDNKFLIFQIGEKNNFESEEFWDWILLPIESKTLSAESINNDILDGYFIIKARWIKEYGEVENCYINITMPERISDEVYIKRDNKIIRLPSYELRGEFVPSVSIEGFGVYELFYSKLQPEIGIQVLRDGLISATKKAAIAGDLAYILRDEGRHSEAIEAFTMVIEEENSEYAMPNEATFAE